MSDGAVELAEESLERRTKHHEVAAWTQPRGGRPHFVAVLFDVLFENVNVDEWG